MAIIKAVRSHSGLKKIIDYVSRTEKTEGKYLSTHHCQIESAAQEMTVTKQMYGKETGVTYYHFIQSFPPDEAITPEQANQVAKDLAVGRWPDYEMVIGTHVDRDHIHSHIIINSVSMETGKKLHFSPVDLKEMKHRNIEMCQERGLSVPVKGQQITTNKPEKYMAILRGTEGHYKSYVLDTALAVSEAKERATSREEFIEKLEEQGYRTTWTDNRKHITFMDSEGRKVRNSNLTKTFKQDFSKEALIHEFRRNQERAEEHPRADTPAGNDHHLREEREAPAKDIMQGKETQLESGSHVLPRENHQR
ncbi:MAG: relaxase/mobilization nuclease domain-containing protein [Christensenella sp.]|uniref:relaxase/mobilization nuclease domain-containing protein n=1 Tax=Christensenella sp. TaxID=1935934 RepID=UPI002B20B006|nr:relaxase/mobilization nuclease domain-containing protein [Christensenella sp.]MEA5002750.1 relaxase/mobilization nuclease domain-containing protein [Christensenella sp.]